VTSAGESVPVVDRTLRRLTTLVEFGSDPADAGVTVMGTPAALWA
jgi:hypothetical protein